MTATEELHHLLDERGAEYGFVHGYKIFQWDCDGADGKGSVSATEVDGGINIVACGLTPAQAVAATLGRGECHDTWDTELTGRLRFQCSECGAVSLEIAPRFCPACGREVVSA